MINETTKSLDELIKEINLTIARGDQISPDQILGALLLIRDALSEVKS